MLTKFPGAVSTNAAISADTHPAEKYLASLPSTQSKRTMRTAFNNIALLHGVKPAVQFDRDQTGREKKHDVTYLACNWAALTPRHVAAIRAKLIKLYNPSSVHKILSPLPAVLQPPSDPPLIRPPDTHQAL